MNAKFIRHLGKKFGFNPFSEWKEYRSLTPEERGMMMSEEANLILSEVSIATGVNAKVILSLTRKREVVYIRHALSKIYHDNGLGSLSMIGLFTSVGGRGRNHASVLHSIRTANDLISTNENEFMLIWNKIKHLDNQITL